MNKQKMYIVFVVVVVVGVVVLYFKYNGYQKLLSSGSGMATSTDSITLNQAKQLLQTATITVPDYPKETVTLKAGTAEFKIEDEGGKALSVPGEIDLGDAVAVKSVTASNKPDSVISNDILTTVVVNSGGSGNFIYLVLFQLEKGVLVQKSYTFLGDRIIVEKIGLTEQLAHSEEYGVGVNILDRQANEPMASEPTVRKTLGFSVTSGTIVPLDTTPAD